MTNGTTNGTTRQVPAEIEEILSNWDKSARYLRFLNVIIGLIATIASITVASRFIESTTAFYGLNTSYIMSVLAWIAAIATGILTSVNVGDCSNNLLMAWRMLNEAKIRYLYQEDYEINNLIDAYRDGEKLAGKLVVSLK